MADVTVIEGEPSPAPLATEVPATQAEVLATDRAEAQAEVAETVADSAVEIARIEAERDTQIAETHAEVETARIEAEAEAREGREEWRTELNSLRTDLQAVAEAVAAMEPILTALSTPPASQEVVEVTTPTVSSETRTEPSSETRTEVLDASAVAEPVPVVPVIVKRKARMI